MEGSRCASLLLQQFHSFSHAYYVSLMPGPPAAPEYETLDDVEISRAYIAIKLWFLLSRKASEKSGMEFDTTGQLDTQDAEASSARMIWNQLWPPFEMVLQALESDSRATSSLVSYTSRSVLHRPLINRHPDARVSLCRGSLSLSAPIPIRYCATILFT